MQTVYFIGIDLAFSAKNNTGVSILSGTQGGDLTELSYIGSRLCKTDEEIMEFILPYLLPGSSAVGVDAPLVVPNATGMRTCEREVARMFGSRQCTAYPGNQGNMAGTRGPKLLSSIEGHGVPIVADPRMDKYSDSVHFMETYPHAAHLSMFDLPTVWKYKKKSGRSWELCRSELVEYWRRIWSLLPEAAAQVLKMADTDPLGQRLIDWMPAIQQSGRQRAATRAVAIQEPAVQHADADIQDAGTQGTGAQGGDIQNPFNQEPMNVQPPTIIGKQYKEFEDLTDGLFCAYMAAHIYMRKPTQLFSSTSQGSTNLSQYIEGDGFIVVPTIKVL